MSSLNTSNKDIPPRNLKSLRQNLDLSQLDMAERLGIKQNSYSAIERGVNRITERQLATLGEKFNVNLNWLLLGKGEMFLPEEAELQKAQDFKQYVLDNLKNNYHFIQNLGDAVQEIQKDCDRAHAENAELRRRVGLLEGKLTS